MIEPITLLEEHSLHLCHLSKRMGSFASYLTLSTPPLWTFIVIGTRKRHRLSLKAFGVQWSYDSDPTWQELDVEHDSVQLFKLKVFPGHLRKAILT
jgi:hypothetical protein